MVTSALEMFRPCRVPHSETQRFGLCPLGGLLTPDTLMFRTDPENWLPLAATGSQAACESRSPGHEDLSNHQGSLQGRSGCDGSFAVRRTSNARLAAVLALPGIRSVSQTKKAKQASRRRLRDSDSRFVPGIGISGLRPRSARPALKRRSGEEARPPLRGLGTSGTSSASTPVRCTTASATPRSCGSDFAFPTCSPPVVHEPPGPPLLTDRTLNKTQNTPFCRRLPVGQFRSTHSLAAQSHRCAP